MIYILIFIQKFYFVFYDVFLKVTPMTEKHLFLLFKWKFSKIYTCYCLLRIVFHWIELYYLFYFNNDAETSIENYPLAAFFIMTLLRLLLTFLNFLFVLSRLSLLLVNQERFAIWLKWIKKFIHVLNIYFFIW